MNQFKRAQVIMLPTNQKFNIGDYIISKYPDTLLNGKLMSGIKKCEGNVEEINQHLYIISDDEIKEVDWYIELDVNNLPLSVKKADYKKTNEFSLKPYSDYCKKIIATTDTSLKIEKQVGTWIGTDYALPQPSQQFIEKYIESYNKGNIIKDVLVEYEEIYNDYGETDIFDLVCTNHSKISKIKINPKDNTITIKKLKDSWNKDEVINIINQYTIEMAPEIKNFHRDKWINENL